MNRSIMTVLCFFAVTGSANAYMDPGSGSIVIQGIIAAIVGFFYTIKVYWYKIKSFFARTNFNETNGDVIKSKVIGESRE